MPDLVNGYADDVTKYDYNPTKAKDLLKQAGAEGATIEFNYPTDVSRPYMPSPEDTFNVIRSQLGGRRPQGHAGQRPLGPGLPGHDPGHGRKHGIHLLGWTGDYNDPDNFVGVFFGQQVAGVGLRQQEAVRRPQQGAPDPDRRGADRAVQGDQPRDHGLPARSPAGCTRCRRSPSPRACRASSPARSRTRSTTTSPSLADPRPCPGGFTPPGHGYVLVRTPRADQEEVACSGS